VERFGEDKASYLTLIIFPLAVAAILKSKYCSYHLAKVSVKSEYYFRAGIHEAVVGRGSVWLLSLSSKAALRSGNSAGLGAGGSVLQTWL